LSFAEIIQYADEAEMLSHCVPLFFLPSYDSRPTGIFANGTGALIQAPQARLLVTCAHVLTGFRKFLEREPNGVLAAIFKKGVGWPVLIDLNSLIDEGEGLLDLATFRVPQEWDTGLKQFYRLDLMPPPDIQESRLVTVLGFPGSHRRPSQSKCAFNYSAFGTSVTHVSNTTFLLSNDLRTFDNDGNEIDPIDKGGMSGSPVYLKTPNQLNLCGLLAGESSNGIEVVKAKFLDPSGRLHR
jgi:hypothetical protein